MGLNQERTKKATIALYSCKKEIGLRWGMSPRIVNWIYTAVVKPILLYGVALWWTTLHKQCILTPLNKVQRMAALCISGAFQTTPNEAILNLPKILQHDKSIPKITDLCKSIEYSRTPFEALIPDREESEQGRPGMTDAICFNTDGSKLEGQVGEGVYYEQLDINKSFRLPDHWSVFEAEVNAIKEALTCFGNISLQRGT